MLVVGCVPEMDQVVVLFSFFFLKFETKKVDLLTVSGLPVYTSVVMTVDTSKSRQRGMEILHVGG